MVATVWNQLEIALSGLDPFWPCRDGMTSQEKETLPDRLDGRFANFEPQVRGDQAVAKQGNCPDPRSVSVALLAGNPAARTHGFVSCRDRL